MKVRHIIFHLERFLYKKYYAKVLRYLHAIHVRPNCDSYIIVIGRRRGTIGYWSQSHDASVEELKEVLRVLKEMIHKTKYTVKVKEKEANKCAKKEEIV